MIVTRTPFRIPLGGGGTDLPSYYSQHGGFIVSAAINRYVYIMLNLRFEDSIRVSYSQTEIADCADQVDHPIVREALKLLGLNCNLEIVSIADLPAKTGLGSSCSFTVGLLNALHALKREHVPLEELAEEACHIEIDRLREPIGKQDQYIAAFGGITCLDIDREGGVRPYALNLPGDVVQELENNVMVFYTGIKRSASEVLSAQARAAQEGDPRVLEALHVIKEIGREVKRALEAGDLDRFGSLMDEHWQVKKRLSDKVSNGEIDAWYETARSNGALGGKVMGAGGGGFFMFYCPNGHKGRLREALTAEGLRELRVGVDFEGSKVLMNF
ncbi:MAG: galactokinase [Dehalococcoidia bacterium]|nr:galactokinase [Dehalococcoidia bacterium]